MGFFSDGKLCEIQLKNGLQFTVIYCNEDQILK